MAVESTGNTAVDQKVQEWLRYDQNEKTTAEILQLVKEKDVAELERRMLYRLEFGTAGLRASMGAGNSMMNDLTTIQTTQGLVKHLLSANPEAQQKGVVIGFDGRHNSSRWAQLTATVLVNAKVPAHLFSKMCPTPFVPFSVKHLGAACGIMITASHNPKNDNGYKVYWSNGAQITSPTDKGIAAAILESLEPLKSSWEVEVLKTSPLCLDPYADIWTAYFQHLSQLCSFREVNEKSQVKITYTAMHGVGFPFTTEALKTFGFPAPIPVKEQIQPDPEFPTVKYPNPEEGKGALTLAMQTADANSSSIILANDPDADRLALAEKLPSGEWKIYTGNEMGALLGWWHWYCYTQKNPDAPASDAYMISTAVSSKILQTMAKKHGFNFEETLTGFKWIGNKADEKLKEGKKVLFAFEEAIGFMCFPKVLDKDGVSAAAILTELAACLDTQGKTLHKKLQEIYAEYGHHITNNSYFICHKAATIKAMFDEIRNYQGTGKYPEACGPFKIQHIRDLTVGFDNSQPGNKPVLPVSKSNQMITFFFENGCIATLRTSGTEPKVKYYAEHRPDPSKGLDLAAAQQELEDMVENIKTHFFQWKKFELIPKAD